MSEDSEFQVCAATTELRIPTKWVQFTLLEQTAVGHQMMTSVTPL